MTGHTAPPRGRVSLLGVIAGGLLIGAGGFGLFRVTSANPAGELPALPPLPPVSEGRPDPLGLQPVLPAAAPVPVVLPPLGTLPTPSEVAPPPAPLPPPDLPKVPSPKPLPDPPKPVPLPNVGDLPLPGGFEPPALPALPAVPAPKPVMPPAPMPVPAAVAPPVEIAPLPAVAPIQPMNPEFNLRPAVPGNTVTPKALPAEVPPAPRPVVSVVPAPVGPLDPPPTPGDPPVTLTLRQTALATALGVGFALAPAPAARAEEPKPAAADIELKKQIDDLKKEVAALRKQNEVQGEYLLGRTDGKAPVTQLDHGLLKRVETLEEAIARIEKKVDATKQVVGSSPLGNPTPIGNGGNPPPATTTGSGTIRLINEYPTEVKIVVNGVSHDLKANELKQVTVPAGEFVYELMAAGATKTTSTIKDAERVTLRIR